MIKTIETKIGVLPVVFEHNGCPVTTPYILESFLKLRAKTLCTKFDKNEVIAESDIETIYSNFTAFLKAKTKNKIKELKLLFRDYKQTIADRKFMDKFRD